MVASSSYTTCASAARSIGNCVAALEPVMRLNNHPGPWSHLNVGTLRSINLKQFDRRPIDFNECDYHPGTWTVGRDEDLMMSNG